LAYSRLARHRRSDTLCSPTEGGGYLLLEISGKMGGIPSLQKVYALVTRADGVNPR
jgi:hypothetical protein